ncbi:hypothetical protein [Parageobacillus thermoglucosidasius]|uniref:hypothetical protein n=1 Tax=Parageobacillus thermoglucosidasius TaxID=1426 RepID=UPI002E229AAB|nr:hypothetical protein [Parageobacillus thermoglucosidasius]MED4946463.1 hypothetical protein [Parageobacillus thermoglucosidasius]MED4984024.1 hypothetical protein [Parageobacillus thermoglucosidasius]
MEHYVIGVIDEIVEQDTIYGPRADIYLSLMKSSLGWKEEFVKAVAWRSIAQQATKCRKPQIVMVSFTKFADAEELYRDKSLKKVKATHVSRLNTRELHFYLRDENGHFNPFNW